MPVRRRATGRRPTGTSNRASRGGPDSRRPDRLRRRRGRRPAPRARRPSAEGPTRRSGPGSSPDLRSASICHASSRGSPVKRACSASRSIVPPSVSEGDSMRPMAWVTNDGSASSRGRAQADDAERGRMGPLGRQDGLDGLGRLVQDQRFHAATRRERTTASHARPPKPPTPFPGRRCRP